MARIDDINDHGIEALKKSAVILDDTFKSRYSLRTTIENDSITTTTKPLGLDIPKYDKIDITYPTTSTEKYTFSLEAVDVAIIDLTYSDATKAVLTTVERTL